jgi:hypothetical protein
MSLEPCPGCGAGKLEPPDVGRALNRLVVPDRMSL